MRNYLLVVSSSDEQRRRQMAGCIDATLFAQQLGGLELETTPGYLPRGTLGSQVSFVALQKQLRTKPCTFPGEKPTIDYHNQLPQAQASLENFFAEHADELPFKVHVKSCQLSEIVDSFLKHDEFMYVVGADAAASNSSKLGEPAQFLEQFYDSQRFVPQPVPKVRDLVIAAGKARSWEAKSALYTQAHRELLLSGHIIPLGQIPQVLYFPRFISTMDYADQSLGYPKVESIKCSPVN